MAITIPNNQYVSIKEYANMCHVTKAAVYAAIRTGRLANYKVGNTYIIPTNALISLRRNRDGRMKGISFLKKGDIDGFLKVRGIKKEEGSFYEN